MTIRLEVDIAYNCRPNKGERKAKDGTGRLVKCSIYFGDSLAECLGEATRAQIAGNVMAPGYSEIIAVRGYDNAAYKADPLKAIPTFKSAELI